MIAIPTRSRKSPGSKPAGGRRRALGKAAAPAAVSILQQLHLSPNSSLLCPPRPCRGPSPGPTASSCPAVTVPIAMDNTDRASSVPAGAFWAFFLPSPRTGCHLLVLQSKSRCGVAVQGWWWWWRGAPAHLPGKFPGEQRTQSWAPFPSWPRRAAGEVWGAPGSTPPPGSPEAAARSLLSQIHLQVTQPEQGASLPCRAGARAGTYLAYLAAGITSPANPFLLSYSNARLALASPGCRQPPDPAPQGSRHRHGHGAEGAEVVPKFVLLHLCRVRAASLHQQPRGQLAGFEPCCPEAASHLLSPCPCTSLRQPPRQGCSSKAEGTVRKGIKAPLQEVGAWQQLFAPPVPPLTLLSARRAPCCRA